MKKIEEKLIRLEPTILDQIRCGLSTIYKISHDEVFKEATRKVTQITKAQYIVYSNFNNVYECILLSDDGESLYKSTRDAYGFAYDDLDIEINFLELSTKQPIKVPLEVFGFGCAITA